MSTIQPPLHEIENWYIVSLVSALYGSISPNMRAITLSDASPESVTLHFLLAAESASDREEIDDICFEFQALQLRPVECRVEITIGESFEHFTALPGRGVYHRKE